MPEIGGDDGCGEWAIFQGTYIEPWFGDTGPLVAHTDLRSVEGTI